MATVRPPVYTEHDFGPIGWRELNEEAKARGRSVPRELRLQLLPLILFALYRRHLGEDVELTRRQRETLFASELEVPAA